MGLIYTRLTPHQRDTFSSGLGGVADDLGELDSSDAFLLNWWSERVFSEFFFVKMGNNFSNKTDASLSQFPKQNQFFFVHFVSVKNPENRQVFPIFIKIKVSPWYGSAAFKIYLYIAKI